MKYIQKLDEIFKINEASTETMSAQRRNKSIPPNATEIGKSKINKIKGIK